MMKKLNTLLVAALMAFGLPATTHAYTISSTFNDLNPMDIGFSPIEWDPIFDGTSIDFTITNSTGQTWTDFHMTETTAIVGAVLGPFTYSGLGTATWSTDYSTIDILDLNIVDASTLNFSIGCGNNCGGLIFNGFPTVDSGGNGGNGGNGGGASVPEPGILLLLSTGLLGLLVFRKRRFTTTTQA